MPESNREKTIFCAAIEIDDPDARAAFVQESCLGDPALACRVNDLLAAAQPAARFLPDAPDLPSDALASDDDAAGSVLGKYKLLERLGEGGFGVVYMAEQSEPVRRRVALKLVKPGMDSKQLLGRFEAERQALALMSHPNIAQVFDAGTTDQGRPYFVMELVRGTPITQFCREHDLDPEARLRLFIDVCSAVQHAHQKGVIHRDLKPSNILVALQGDKAVLKVIDFGIAKAIDQPLTDRTVFTQFHQFLGTPAYVSPEQASLSGVDVDTRSDIYSLGILLYELVAGSPPFTNEELLSAGLDEMRRIIREKDPERPSSRLRRKENRTASPPPARRSPFASDLDSIVLKALEKDRDRRYETANGLLMDIRRYLANEPVVARPPSKLYRARKYCRRHRSEVIIAITIVVLLLAGILASATLAVRARSAEHRARIEAATSAAVAEFYWKDLLKQLSPGDFTNRTVTLREALDVAEARAPIRLSNQPLAEATVSLALGAAYTRCSDYERARRHIQRAVDLRRTHLGEDNALTAEALLGLADNSQFRADKESAFTNFAHAREILTRLFDHRHPDAVRAALGEAWNRTPPPPYADATNRLTELVLLSEEVRGPNDIQTRIALNYLGLTHQEQGDLEGALRLIEESYRRALIDEGPEAGNTLIALERLSGLQAQQGRFSEANRLFQKVYDVRLRNFGPGHPLTLFQFKVVLLQSVLLPQHQYAEALDAIENHIRLCAAETDSEWDWRSPLEQCLNLVATRIKAAEDATPLPDAAALHARLAAARESLAQR